ncbi:glycine-rich protein family, partial [Trichomonas vaginalis G3]
MQDRSLNGGGNSGYDTGTVGTSDDDPSGGGGGATDIRLISDSTNKSLYSRIIVAAGGSGSALNSFGAPGGDLTGYKVQSLYKKDFVKSDTTQTSGYKLGQGQDGQNYINVPPSGAGGGYYGGKAGELEPLNAKFYRAVSSSGSSFISGYEGCNSVDENGIHTNQSKHYSGI